jgi:hypothetical protein
MIIMKLIDYNQFFFSSNHWEKAQDSFICRQNQSLSEPAFFIGTTLVELFYSSKYNLNQIHIILESKKGKPSVIPVSSVPVFKFENSLFPASRVPTPVIPVSVIPVFHIIFHINLIKKSSRQGPPTGITDKSPR